MNNRYIIHGIINIRDDMRPDDASSLKQEIGKLGGFRTFRTYSQEKGMPHAYSSVEITGVWPNGNKQEAIEAVLAFFKRCKPYLLPGHAMTIYTVGETVQTWEA
jgi:hypothetical protein